MRPNDNNYDIGDIEDVRPIVPSPAVVAAQKKAQAMKAKAARMEQRLTQLTQSVSVLKERFAKIESAWASVDKMRVANAAAANNRLQEIQRQSETRKRLSTIAPIQGGKRMYLQPNVNYPPQVFVPQVVNAMPPPSVMTHQQPNQWICYSQFHPPLMPIRGISSGLQPIRYVMPQSTQWGNFPSHPLCNQHPHGVPTQMIPSATHNVPTSQLRPVHYGAFHNQFRSSLPTPRVTHHSNPIIPRRTHCLQPEVQHIRSQTGNSLPPVTTAETPPPAYQDEILPDIPTPAPIRATESPLVMSAFKSSDGLRALAQPRRTRTSTVEPRRTFIFQRSMADLKKHVPLSNS